MIWNDVFCIPPIQVCDKQSIDLFHLEYKFVHTADQASRGGKTFLQWHNNRSQTNTGINR